MNEELREALARWSWDRPGKPDQLSYEMADEVLALPEVAALLADAERVRRVRELHAPVDRSTGPPHCWECATHITFTYWPCSTIRALDGDGA